MDDQAKPTEVLLFEVGQSHYQEVAQGLLNVKAAARSVESGCQALAAIANKTTADELKAMALAGKNLSDQAAELYEQIAKYSFQ